VPQVGTLVNGVVAVSSVYDAEDAQGFATIFAGATSLTNCSSQPEYAEGPPYAGGAMTSSTQGAAASAYLGITFDTSRMHDVQTWSIVDPSWTSVSAASTLAEITRINQTVPCFVIQQYRNGTADNLALGAWYVSYDIDLIHPTNPSTNN